MTRTRIYKFNHKLCDTCPHLDHCLAFPYVAMGHHPNARCPDGFVEKILPQEVPGPNYKGGGGKFGEKVVDTGTWAIFNREGYDGYKSKRCLVCGDAISKGSRYWLCHAHAREFVEWRRKNREYMEERKRKHRERGVFLLGIGESAWQF